MNTKLNIESIIDGSIEKGKLSESVQESLSKADAAMQSTDVETLLEDFVHKDDTINFANDLTGVVEATSEMFTYRPSAGDKSVRDESAVIRRIKGNTSVWGQGLNLAIDQTGSNGWWFRNPEAGGNVRVEGNTIKYDIISEKGSNQQISQYVGDLIVGNTYLLLFSFNNNGVVNDYWGRPWFVLFSTNLYGTASQAVYSPQNNATEGDVALFITIEKEDLKYVILKQPYVNLSNDEIIPTTMEWSNIQLFDLTQMFGDGNEPTTIEEFHKYYPDTYYPYCQTEVRSMRSTGIETTGFNQFNGSVLNGYINDANGEHIVTPWYKCTDYISVLSNQEYYINTEQTGGFWGAWYDSDKKFISGIVLFDSNPLATSPTNAAYMRMTIVTQTGGGNPDTYCINLSHSGVRNGEYEPYEKNTLLLPEIAKYFPNGMHGIGDVCDEIIDGLAIQRCAVRAYEEGDENNAEVKTDKITTVYKLSEPIYTPIDVPLQLTYKVDDFGTEKMLSDAPSSPFKADIVYQFNAEGRIRDNSRNIERLENNIIDKQDTITDLDDIRDGAYKGKTSVQSITINGESKTPDENGIVDLGNIEGGGVYVSTLVYKATSKVENTENSWNENTFGAPIIRHDYDEPTGVGVIYFNDRITTIGDSAFSNCTSLTSVTIPDSVTTIGEGAFTGCRSLTSVTIGDIVTTIGRFAFNWCTNLTSITIPNSVTSIGSETFYNCNSLTSVTIGAGVTTIGENAFRGCTGELVVNCNIPLLAFQSSKFTSVTIGDSVTEIGIQAFLNCNSLTSVTIGNSVTTIGNQVFYSCSSLSSVYCLAVTPSTGSSNMFNNTYGCKIYVPMESVDAYKSATGWSDYADDIVGYRFNADFNDYYTKSETDNKIEEVISDLADVAQSGSYNDLSDKPTIPSAITESIVSGWGFTKNTGTITEVSANGTSIATSGVADIPAASISQYGVTKLSSLTNSSSTILAATPKAVKSAYDLADSAYDLADSKYTKPEDGISYEDLHQDILGELALAVTSVQLSDVEYEVVSFTIDDIDNCIMRGSEEFTIDNELNGGNFRKGKPLMIKKNADSEALYPLTYTKQGNALALNYGGTISCVVEGVTYEFYISYSNSNTVATILNIKRYYTQPYVLEFTVEDIITVFEDEEGSIEYDSFALYNAFKNGRSVVIKHDNSTNSKVHNVIGSNEVALLSSSAEFAWYFINNNSIYRVLTFLSDQPGGIYGISFENVTEYSLPNLINGYASLIARSNLKTINGTSIYKEHGASGNIYTYYPSSTVTRSSVTITISPNTFYKFGTSTTPLTSIGITLGTEISGVVNEYIFEIYTNETTVPSLSLPDTIKWVSGNSPVLEANKTYQISIVNNLGTVLSWDNA